MKDEDLRKMLEQLHGEIERTDTVDEKGKKMLRDLSLDIRDLLDRSSDDAPPSLQSTLDQLQKSIDYFEVTHPTLNTVLTKLFTLLSSAGI